MKIIIGYVFILACLLGSFVAVGGHVASLWQPAEYVIILGSALGAFYISNSPAVLKATGKALKDLFKSSPYTKAMFMDLLCLLFEILGKVRREGLMSIEGDVEDPHSSSLFQKYAVISANHHIIEFLTDYLRLMVGGNLNALEIEGLMDAEIDTLHKEELMPAAAVGRIADGLPAFGIVAAVMGVVHTMESVGLPPAELGLLIGAALVGTFIGILFSYAFVGPLSTGIEARVSESGRLFDCAKVTLLASLNGYAPQVAVEFGRKVLFSNVRPTFLELEEECKARKNG